MTDRMNSTACLRVLASGILLASHLGAAGDFTDISSGSGLNSNALHSMVFADFNNDGYLDMAKGNVSVSGVRTISINDGDKTFTTSTAALPVGYRGLGWGDYDNDGDVDLVGRDTSLSPDVNRNDGAADGLSWTEFTQAANNNEAVMFADIDGDGDLDVWNMGGSFVWHRNDGGTTFSAQTNMPGVTGEDLPNGEGCTAADFTNDGYIDFMWNDSDETNTSTQAWTNDGDFTYTNHENVNTDFGLPESVGNHENMEWAWGDYDNDGDLDVFVSGTHGVGLYRNNGSGVFTDVSIAAAVTITATTDGADWGDFDNDGDLDLIVAKGALSVVYSNNNDGTFTDVTATVGDPSIGNVVGWIDIDNDGDLDLMDGEGGLWENDQNDTDYLRILVRGAGAANTSPRTPIGAQVDVYEAGTANLVGHRELLAGYNNFQPSPWLHFGLDSTATYDIVVLFPSSQVTVTWSDVQPNQESHTIGATTLNNTVEIVEQVPVLADHNTGQEQDAFTGSGEETNAELFSFEIDPDGQTLTVTNLVFTLTNINCSSDSDWAGVEIVEDSNDDGTIGVGETTTVGGSGTVSQSGGTITFAVSFGVTATTSYILRADFAVLSGAETVTIGLTAGNVTANPNIAGSTTSVTHSEPDVVSGLVSHWKLNETGGLTATDSAGSNDGTLINGPTWTTSGKFCGALDFNEADDEYVTISNDTSLQLTSALSISAWIRGNAWGTGSDVDIVLRKGENNPNNYQMAIVDGTLSLMLDANDNTGFTGDTTLNTGQWYHVAATWDGTTARLYVDGSLDRSPPDTHSGPIGTDTRVAYIGGRSGLDRFDGVIDDVRLYNRALTVAEIQALSASYTIIDLGSYTGDPSFGFGINAASDIAGYDEDATTDDESAWSWSSCVLTDLGSLGGTPIQANDINDIGNVVGEGETAGGDIHAFFHDGSLTDLGTLSGKTDSSAIGINNIDDIAGVSFNVNSGVPFERLAFLDVSVARYGLSAGMNSLGTLGGKESLAVDVNGLGEVVGGAQDSSGNSFPFIWLPAGTAPKYGFGSDGMNSLGTLGGNSAQVIHRAQAINANGEIAGISYTAGGAIHAFLWLPAGAYSLPAGMNDLGTLTGGTTSFAFGINDSGQVIGASEITGGDYHAFLWESGVMTDLNDLIDPNSSWILMRAMDINADGEITGWGTNLDSVTRGFVLTACYSGGAGDGLAQGGGAGRGQVASAASFPDEQGERAPVAVDDQGQDDDASLPLPCGVSLLPLLALIVSALARRSAGVNSH